MVIIWSFLIVCVIITVLINLNLLKKVPLTFPVFIIKMFIWLLIAYLIHYGELHGLYNSVRFIIGSFIIIMAILAFVNIGLIIGLYIDDSKKVKKDDLWLIVELDALGTFGTMIIFPIYLSFFK